VAVKAEYVGQPGSLVEPAAGAVKDEDVGPCTGDLDLDRAARRCKDPRSSRKGVAPVAVEDKPDAQRNAETSLADSPKRSGRCPAATNPSLPKAPPTPWPPDGP